MTALVRVFPTVGELSVAVADAIAATLNSTIAKRGRSSLVLSGGRTPQDLYRVLAAKHRTTIQWSLVDVFWGDERLVPSGDACRNDRMAREMLLRHVPCPESHIHPMAPHAMLDESA